MGFRKLLLCFFMFYVFFFNNVMIWKFVGVLEVLVYIYIYIDE